MSPVHATPEQFRDWLINPPSEPKLVRVTPDIAYAALLFNDETLQRPLSSHMVSEYARRMLMDDWALVPDPLAFDTAGRPQNGQHRLHAVVESGRTIDAWCHFGLSEDLFGYYDIGKKRGSGDVFSIKGVPNYTQASTVTRWLFRYHGATGAAHPKHADGAKPSIDTPVESYNYYLALGPERVADTLKHYYRLKKARLGNPAPIAACAYVGLGLDETLADEFFRSLASGSNLSPRSMVKRLRDHLLRESTSLTSHHVMDLTIRAWNANRTKRRTFPLTPAEKKMGMAPMV